MLQSYACICRCRSVRAIASVATCEQSRRPGRTRGASSTPARVPRALHSNSSRTAATSSGRATARRSSSARPRPRSRSEPPHAARPHGRTATRPHGCRRSPLAGSRWGHRLEACSPASVAPAGDRSLARRYRFTVCPWWFIRYVHFFDFGLAFPFEVLRFHLFDPLFGRARARDVRRVMIATSSPELILLAARVWPLRWHRLLGGAQEEKLSIWPTFVTS